MRVQSMQFTYALAIICHFVCACYLLIINPNPKLPYYFLVLKLASQCEVKMSLLYKVVVVTSMII